MENKKPFSIKKYFRCPVCGERITRYRQDVTTRTDELFAPELSDPICVGCGRTFIINIHEDLSVEIIEN